MDEWQIQNNKYIMYTHMQYVYNMIMINKIVKPEKQGCGMLMIT